MNNEQILNEISKMEATLAKLKAELQKPEAPEPWKPEEGEDVHFVTGTCYVHSIPYFDKAYREFVKAGNYFKTPERAEQVASKYRNLLKLEQLHDMFCPDYVPDWNKADAKYAVFYHHNRHCWEWGEAHTTETTVAYFDSEETAKKVCDILNKEECNSECK